MLRSGAWLCLCALAFACRPASPEARVLRHALTLPKNNPTGVFLNEDLVFYFTGDLDRASVTGESVRITSASDGRLVRGSLSVEGKALKFTPAPVLARDLSDGGYLPGTAYQVEIRGFPAVDGLRGTGGEPLERTYRFQFTTVANEGGNLMFVDTAPEKTKLLALAPPPASAAESRYPIGVGDPIYVASGKPIDPATLRDDVFELVKVGNNVASENIVGDKIISVDLRAQLVENVGEARRARAPAGASESSGWEREPRAALLALTPVSRLTEGTWRLRPITDAESPRDFSGHPLVSAGLFAREINVVERTDDTGRGEQVLDFLDKNLLSPVALPGVDGSACWSQGRVWLRYPAAAGDGSRGDVVLGNAVEDADMQAGSIVLPGGSTCTLPSRPGLSVLRCQGRMVLSGNLQRTVISADKEADVRLKESNSNFSLSARAGTTARVETLTAWLARAASEKLNCTVLIAGGDIVIESAASMLLNTPLLLVAGGTVRVEGSVHVTSGFVFVLGDGGGLHLDPGKQTADLLDMDAPAIDHNPLQRKLHCAVLSSPLPTRGAVAAWKKSEYKGSGKDSHPEWSVRFVREIGTMPGSIAELEPVDDPMALDPAGSIQVLIELWIGPGATFEPPWVDYVRLRWDQRVTGRSH